MMFKVRKTIKDDILDIITLEKTYLGDTIGEKMLAAELHNKYAYFYTALADEKVIGYIGCWIIEDECEMINFVVDEPFQRKGVGTILIQTVIDETKNAGGKLITLEVNVNNEKAKNFYRKQGFYEIAKRHNYYPDGSDAVVLRKDII